MPTSIRKADDIQDVLRLASARRELVILVTPYLRYESTFMGIQDGEVHVLATMSREDALYGLRSHALKIRFPQGLGFYEAEVSVKGLGMLEGRRTLRFSLPKQLKENDQRVAYRVERVGRVTVTFTTRKHQLVQGSLTNLSTSGARLHAERDLPSEDLDVGDRLQLSVPLDADLRFDASVTVRHVQMRTFGVEFTPALTPDVLDPLSRWIFVRREEERERLVSRLELAAPGNRPAGTPIPREGIVLVSQDAALEDVLREALRPLQPLARVSPAAQAFKEALQAHPSLIIFHVAALNLDARRRLRALADVAHGKAPSLLLGTSVDGSDLFELAGELKVSSALGWHEGRAAFLERLARGIIRRHQGLEDAPLAPAEP